MADQQGVSNDELDKLEELLNKDQARKLGQMLVKLGRLAAAEVSNFMATNTLSGSVTKDGTRMMLSEWHTRTPKRDQRRELKNALSGAKLIKQLEEFFGEESTLGSSSSPPAAASTSGTVEAGSTVVTGSQINVLVKLLPYDKYSELSTNLGMEHPESAKILKENNNEYNPAYRQVLTQWKLKEGGGRRADLEKALRDADIGSFCDKF